MGAEIESFTIDFIGPQKATDVRSGLQENALMAFPRQRQRRNYPWETSTDHNKRVNRDHGFAIHQSRLGAAKKSTGCIANQNLGVQFVVDMEVLTVKEKLFDG